MRTWRWWTLIVAAVALAVAAPGCSCDKSPAAGGDADTDTGTGADTDTDTDADSDTDTDTGSSICQEGPLELEWTPLPEGVDCGPGCRQLTFEPINSVTGWAVDTDYFVGTLDDSGNAVVVSIQGSVYSEFEAFFSGDGSKSFSRVDTFDQVLVLLSAIYTASGREKHILQLRKNSTENFDVSCWESVGNEDSDYSYRNVACSGTHIAFLYTRPGMTSESQVKLINMSSGVTQNIADDFFDRFYCRLSDTHLVWSQGPTNCNGDIWAHDLTTKNTWNLTNHEADQFMPRIDGTRVVWTDNRNGPGGFVNADIYVHDFSTGETTRLTDGEWIQMKPDISGDRVVFEDYRASTDPNSQGSFDGVDIWMVDISTGEETQLTSSPGPEGDPKIVGDKLYYFAPVPYETYFAIFEQDLTALGL